VLRRPATASVSTPGSHEGARGERAEEGNGRIGERGLADIRNTVPCLPLFDDDDDEMPTILSY